MFQRASTAAQIAAAKASQINAKLGVSGAAPQNLPEMAQPTHSETMMVPDHMVGLCKFRLLDFFVEICAHLSSC